MLDLANKPRYVVQETPKGQVVVKNAYEAEIDIDQETQDELLTILKRINEINAHEINPIDELRNSGFKFGKVDYSWKPKDRNDI